MVEELDMLMEFLMKLIECMFVVQLIWLRCSCVVKKWERAGLQCKQAQ